MGFSYIYNHQDLLLKVIGADGNALESYTYDRLGRRRTHVIGDRLYQHYHYDVAGNLTDYTKGKKEPGCRVIAATLRER